MEHCHNQRHIDRSALYWKAVIFYLDAFEGNDF